MFHETCFNPVWSVSLADPEVKIDLLWEQNNGLACLPCLSCLTLDGSTEVISHSLTVVKNLFRLSPHCSFNDR